MDRIERIKAYNAAKKNAESEEKEAQRCDCLEYNIRNRDLHHRIESAGDRLDQTGVRTQQKHTEDRGDDIQCGMQSGCALSFHRSANRGKNTGHRGTDICAEHKRKRSGE